jgi:hypothetical protein
MLAIGQPSTDSVGAHEGEPHGSSDHPRPAIVLREEGQTLFAKPIQRSGGVDLPPRPEPAAAAKAHAVFMNSAHGWRSNGYGT